MNFLYKTIIFSYISSLVTIKDKIIIQVDGDEVSSSKRKRLKNMEYIVYYLKSVSFFFLLEKAEKETLKSLSPEQ